MLATGAAAHNVLGKTVHSLFGVNPMRPNKAVAGKTLKHLKRLMLRTLVLLIDERSMLSSVVLGAAEQNAALTAHGGVHQEDDWGGIPVVILVGDDFQIPPVEGKGASGKGAFRLMSGDRRAVSYGCRSNVEAWGAGQFLKLSTHVMELTTLKRQDESETTFRRILATTRIGKLTKKDAELLDRLHKEKRSPDEWKEIEAKAIRIFANNEPRIEHNQKQLAADSSEENPVAFVQPQGTSSFRPGKHYASHFNKSSMPKIEMICRGAKVCIKGKNFMPEWGLYNGAIGTVREIVFKPGDNPNLKHMPVYVAVEFKGYSGPKWDKDNPKVRVPPMTAEVRSANIRLTLFWRPTTARLPTTQIVPIPMAAVMCEKRCCDLEYCPLTLSYGRTLHTFQGQSAGPTPKNKPDNEVEAIICDPGTRQFEGLNPGIFYTMLSRATTIGDENGVGSAIYFDLSNMSPNRCMNLTLTKKGETFSKVLLRNKWVQYLDSKPRPPKLTEKQTEELISWVKRTKFNIQELDRRIANNAWRE